MSDSAEDNPPVTVYAVTELAHRYVRQSAGATVPVEKTNGDFFRRERRNSAGLRFWIERAREAVERLSPEHGEVHQKGVGHAQGDTGQHLQRRVAHQLLEVDVHNVLL